MRDGVWHPLSQRREAPSVADHVRMWHKPAVGGRAEHVRSARVYSDINLFRYCQGIVYFDPEIPDRAFDLGVAEQKRDSPKVACAPVNQGSFRAS